MVHHVIDRSSLIERCHRLTDGWQLSDATIMVGCCCSCRHHHYIQVLSLLFLPIRMLVPNRYTRQPTTQSNAEKGAASQATAVVAVVLYLSTDLSTHLGFVLVAIDVFITVSLDEILTHSPLDSQTSSLFDETPSGLS